MHLIEAFLPSHSAKHIRLHHRLKFHLSISNRRALQSNLSFFYIFISSPMKHGVVLKIDWIQVLLHIYFRYISYHNFL